MSVDFFEATGMRGLAEKLGLRYVRSPTDHAYVAETGGLPRVSILREQQDSVVSDLMYGRLAGLNVQLFNVDLAVYRENPAATERSCMVVNFSADFPRIEIGPHTPMSRVRAKANWRALQFAPQAFTDRFRFEGVEADEAALILGPELIDFMVRSLDEVRIDIEGVVLFAHVSRVDEFGFLRLVEYVQQFHENIPAYAWVRYMKF